MTVTKELTEIIGGIYLEQPDITSGSWVMMKGLNTKKYNNGETAVVHGFGRTPSAGATR